MTNHTERNTTMRMPRTTPSWTLSGLLLLGYAMNTAAVDVILNPTGVSASLETYQVATKTIDGSGLSAPLATGDALPGLWPTHDTAQSTMWLAQPAGQFSLTITFDLGNPYTVSGFHLWNENEAGLGNPSRRGSKDAVLSSSLTGLAGSYTVISFSPTPFVGAPGLTSYRGDDYTLATSVNARYLKFDISSVFNDVLGGMSEVRFVGSPVPEPTALALLGLGAAGLRTRRPRATCAPV